MGAPWLKSPGPVLLGTLSKGTVTIEWLTHFYAMPKPPNTVFKVWRGLPWHVGRNMIVRDALQLGASYLMFLDTDVFPPAHAFPQLYYWRLPIVSGLYWSKRGYPAMWRAVPGSKEVRPITEYSHNVLVQADYVGMGVCLIDMRVFQFIPEPWFDWTLDRPDIPLSGFSEDFFFCDNARRAGFPVYVDVNVQCLHEDTLPKDTKGQEAIYPGTERS